MAVPTIKILGLRLGVSTTLQIHHPMLMGPPEDAQPGHPSNLLYMLQLLRWAGIQVLLSLTHKHIFLTGLQLEHRSKTLLYIIPPTIAQMVTQITMVEINRLQSG